MNEPISNNPDERGLLPYPVILAATKGDPEAMKIVVQHYASYIAYLSTRKVRDEYGNVYYGIDEDSVVKRRWLSLSCFPQLLSLVKHLLRDNGLIAAEDEELLSFSSVAFLFPRERVCCIPFLEKCISCVALILQDIVNRFSPPMPSKRLIFVQSSSNFS